MKKSNLKDKITSMNYNLSNDLLRSKINLSCLSNVVLSEIKTKVKNYKKTDITMSSDNFKNEILKIISSSDYRVDIKAYKEHTYAQLKNIFKDCAYIEIDSSNFKKINEMTCRLGLWNENIKYEHGFDFVVIINSGIREHSIIHLNVKIGE